MKNLFHQFFKYGLSSVLTYAFLLGGVFFLTDIVGMPANISYFIVLTITYGLNYVLASHFIFSKKLTKHKFMLFCLYVLIFWALNNLIFNVLFKNTNIHYLIITGINILIFVPLRFFSLRHIFTSEDADKLNEI